MSLHLFSQILLRRSHEWLEQVTVGRRGHILWAPCHELLEQSRWNSLGITTIYYLSFYYTSEVNSHACDDRDIHVNAGHRSPALVAVVLNCWQKGCRIYFPWDSWQERVKVKWMICLCCCEFRSVLWHCCLDNVNSLLKHATEVVLLDWKTIFRWQHAWNKSSAVKEIYVRHETRWSKIEIFQANQACMKFQKFFLVDYGKEVC